ncbi:DUF438 domain-containing protein [Chloroflexota bacterium]
MKDEPTTAEERKEALRNIVQDLNRGADTAGIKERFRNLIKNLSASELTTLEQQLIDEGTPVSEVKRLSEIHLEVFKESLEKKNIADLEPGHPVHTFIQENRPAEDIINEITEAISSPDEPPAKKKRLGELFEKLSLINRHYLRKENQLFPLLEVHNISGPSKVMWAVHDDIRGLFKKLDSELATLDIAEVKGLSGELLKSVRDIIEKEERILFPMALENLTASEWAAVRESQEEIGYAWIKPEAKWAPEPAGYRTPLCRYNKCSLYPRAHSGIFSHWYTNYHTRF